MHTHIVKRKKGHREAYDSHKVYASCYAACLNAEIHKEAAEALCDTVTKGVNQWIDEKDLVTSEEIFKEVARRMREENKKAAFLYETHRDIS